MSWQATAWAEKQKTGSPSRKVLLLVLANYADENGFCWPSQSRLADGTEQSVDTVQRQLRKLETDGHISRQVRVRKGGHFPAHSYQLNMGARSKVTKPQNAARRANHRVTKAALNADTEPQALRHGQAAMSTDTEPQALRHEYLNKYPIEPLPPRPSQSVGTSKTIVKKRGEIQEIQQRLARKLGRGDLQKGWMLFGDLAPSERKKLEDLEAAGVLDGDALFEFLLAAEQERFEGALVERGGGSKL